MTTVETYRAALTPLTDVVEHVLDWSAPSPCEGWSARDVLDHLVTTQRALLAERGLDVPAGPDPAVDPAGAWRAHGEAVAEMLEHPDVDGLTYEGFFGPTTLGQTVTRFYVFDMLVHRWDLARACGADTVFDAAEIAHIEASADSFADMLYVEGICRAGVEAPEDADRQTRLLARLGRRG